MPLGAARIRSLERGVKSGPDITRSKVCREKGPCLFQVRSDTRSDTRNQPDGGVAGLLEKTGAGAGVEPATY
jgi:hypothetical protein